jgi:hypothetical protein
MLEGSGFPGGADINGGAGGSTLLLEHRGKASKGERTLTISDLEGGREFYFLCGFDVEGEEWDGGKN